MSTREEDFVTKLFVANTHTPVLFFSSRGMAYKMKVWRLPLAAPQARGKALVNLLPLEEGERITSILPLPEDEESWAGFDAVFATTRGTVRRNKLSDFTQVNRNGKIAMKLEDEGDGIVGVALSTERDDILLTTARGQCIRFPVADLRVFKGRDSMGVRGIALGKDDRVISLSILHHFEASAAERDLYLKQSSAIRRAATGEEPEEAADQAEEVIDEADGETDAAGESALSSERYATMGAAEQFVLTVNQRGFGKRSSSFGFRVSGRGGKGIKATDQTKLDEIGPLVAAFPAEAGDQIMLVSDGGTLIRVLVEGIRIASRASKGVRIFHTAEDEKVVSVEHIPDPGEAQNGNEDPSAGGDAVPEAPSGG
jgi:DNA gyrase subunit A